MLFLGQKCWRIMILLLYLSSRKMILVLFLHELQLNWIGIAMFDQSTRLCDIKYKIVFLGHSGVGKSALIERFIHNNFDSNKNQTIGIDFLVKNVTYKGSMYRLQLWDTAGQERFKSLVPNYIRDAHCAVFVYDITRHETLQTIDVWYDLFKEHHRGGAISILVGNKTDLQDKRAVAYADGQAKAEQLGINFAETSALTSKGNVELTSKKPPPAEGETKCQQTGSTSSSGIKKGKVVRVGKERERPSACCYI